MTTPRLLFGIALAAGLVGGSIADQTAGRTPVVAGSYTMLVGDFHVHGFLGDGALEPWALRREAARAGLDVLALTNHNQVVSAKVARWLSGVIDGPLVLAGQEVTNPDYHLIAVGIDRTIDATQPAAGAIDDIHAQGGVAIAAHPGPSAIGWTDDAIARLDGTEVAHAAIHEDPAFRGILAAFFARARDLNPDIAAIGSSDFHLAPSLARCRTFVFARERTEAGVLDAIRHGHTVAMDGDGQLSGDPDLVRLVESLPQSHPPADDAPIARRVSLTLAWIGLLGLICFRKGPDDGV